MGRFRSFITRTVNRPRGRVDAQEHEVVEKLALAVGKTFSLYADIDPDGRPLRKSDRRLVHERLEENAVNLRWLTHERKLLSDLADERGRDFRPMVQVLRMMQRSLVLALSADPLRRMRATSVTDLAGFVKAQWDFLSRVYGLPAWENLPRRSSQATG
jgi:hypothetical protein